MLYIFISISKFPSGIIFLQCEKLLAFLIVRLYCWLFSLFFFVLKYVYFIIIFEKYFLLLCHFRMIDSPFFFWLSLIFMGNLTIISIVHSMYPIYQFPLTAFKIIYLSLVFNIFTIIYLCVVFIVIMLAGICWHS